MSDLVLCSEVEARAALGGKLRERILRPAYPAMGLGRLRVLRVSRDEGGGIELVCGYEGYEPLEGERRARSGAV